MKEGSLLANPASLLFLRTRAFLWYDFLWLHRKSPVLGSPLEYPAFWGKLEGNVLPVTLASPLYYSMQTPPQDVEMTSSQGPLGVVP